MLHVLGSPVFQLQSVNLLLCIAMSGRESMAISLNSRLSGVENYLENEGLLSHEILRSYISRHE